MLARLGKMPEAADYLQRALRITPDFPIARKELDLIRRSHPSAVKVGLTCRSRPKQDFPLHGGFHLCNPLIHRTFRIYANICNL